MKTRNLDPSSNALKLNPDWASLPLFDRSKWQRVRFGDVVRVLKEQVDPASGEVDRYVAGEHMESENVHIRKWGTVGNGYLGPAFIRRFRKGQVLYGSRRTYLKKVAVAEWDGVTSNTTLVLEAVEGKLLQGLLPWLMLSDRFTRHSVAESKGSTNPYINWPDIAKFELELPTLDQQSCWTEIFWTIDAAYEAHKRSMDLAQESYSNLSELKRAKFTQQYPEVALGELIDSDRPLCYGIVQPGTFANNGEGVPFVRVCDMEGGAIKLDSLESVSVEVSHQYRRSIVRANDVLVSIVGTIGRVVVVPPECDEFNIARAVARLAPKSCLDSRFLAALLQTPTLQQQLNGNSFESARKTLNLSSLEKLRVPIPPLAVQRAFLDELASAQNASQIVSVQRNSLKRLSEVFMMNLSLS